MASLESPEKSRREFATIDFKSVMDTLIFEADSAMYRAKRSAKDYMRGRQLSWNEFNEGVA